MPIYEYYCQKCGHEFEVEQRIIEDPIKKCPACRALKAKRLISKTSFVLKGGGWYSDLYSSTGAAKPADGDASADSGKDSASESKSEPKKDKPDKKKAGGGDKGKSAKKSAA